VRPIKDLFLYILPIYNQAVFDNGQNNQSFNSDIIDLMPRLTNIDLVYFDPFYCDSHADYQSFYHLLETYTEYWRDKTFINGTRRYSPLRYSGFDKKHEIVSSLEKLFALANEIPFWLINYNNRSYPSIDVLKNLLNKHRSVNIETKTYLNGRGGKGSVAGSKEILFICRP
jgi:adenine-specific DNA methylase